MDQMIDQDPEQTGTQTGLQSTTPPQQTGVALDFSQAQPIGQTAAPTSTPASTAQPSGGVTLDFSQAQPITPASDELRIGPNDSLPMSVAKGIGGVIEGGGEGIFNTASGASDILDRVTGTQPGGVNRYLHHLAGDDDATHGIPQYLGMGGETVAEFLMGDEALKSLALSDKLLHTAKVAKLLEQSPLLDKAVRIGANALRAGTVQGGDAYIKSSGSAGQAAGQGTLAAGLTGALGVGGATVNAIRAAVDDSGLQPALQQGIRSILSDAATKAGVSEPTAASIRDAAQQVSDGLRAKASSLYQTLDDISGGQAQRFRDAADNVSQQLRSIVGLDDEKEAELLKKQADIELAHQKMLNKLTAAGHDPQMLAKADALWKQQSALSDLSNSIRQSTTGLRPELAKTATGATTPEAVNAKQLFTRVNRLNDRGRLAQAIGQGNADALMQHVDAALVQSQRFADNQKWAKVAAKVGLNLTGLGALSAGYEGVKHLLGAQ